jgi:putative component of membrane protein insertase Oxa1/YidC/SpoIIIJ protein YidD
MARFCACVSQVLTKMFGAFASLCNPLKTYMLAIGRVMSCHAPYLNGGKDDSI